MKTNKGKENFDHVKVRKLCGGRTTYSDDLTLFPTDPGPYLDFYVLLEVVQST